MSATSKPDTSVRPTHGTTTEREPGTGRIITVYPDGRRVVEPQQTTVAAKPR